MLYAKNDDRCLINQPQGGCWEGINNKAEMGHGKYTAQVAVPVSLLQQEVAKLAPDAGKQQIGYTGLAGGQVPTEKEYRPERYSLRERDAAAAVIATMEDSLRHSPRPER